MPVIKSSKKRVRQNAKKTARNARLKKNIRAALQILESKLEAGSRSGVPEAKAKVDSLLDTAGKKKLFHKNKVARRKAQVAKAVRGAGIKAVKKAAVKTAEGATKPKAPRKTPVKTTAVKKAAVKKAKAAASTKSRAKKPKTNS